MGHAKVIKSAFTPKRPLDKDLLIDEIQLIGKYGLKNKHELRVFQKISDDIKRKARDVLISTNKDDLLVVGRDLLKRLINMGVINDLDFTDKMAVTNNLERVLDLTVDQFLERRLQHRVFEAGIANSVHHARVLICSRNICVGGKIITQPGMIIGAEDEPYIEINSRKKKNQVVEEEE
ncbi:40S ribosomal protein S9 [Astathelohania contejeani]|uniref:40S ribosomal protein S9 n=1 Tax=Astathelohania contejeani TaxID=164912 RepID=A0ABQ7HVT4_9MICR|nr:40S ribosomal protein S9 [Thelohania contejeani]